MKGRYKAFLRGTSNKSATGRYMVNIHHDLMEEMGWKVNDNLQIDVIKNGMQRSVNIIKEKE
tara:strand:+ start:348 stop:533 length:186 start_codon:yes stop_codon:yes gene_type:complete